MDDLNEQVEEGAGLAVSMVILVAILVVLLGGLGFALGLAYKLFIYATTL